MEGFLTEVSTKVNQTKEPGILFQESAPRRSNKTIKLDLGNPKNIAIALKEQPDFETVNAILQHLALAVDSNGLNLAIPSPKSAQIADTIVTTTIPDFWGAIKTTPSSRNALLTCLRNGNGIGAILSRLRSLVVDARKKKPDDGSRGSSEQLGDLVDVLERTIEGGRTSLLVREDIRKYAPNKVQERLIWKEYVGQVASGRLISIVAEAEDVIKQSHTLKKVSWIGNGREYSLWLGRNLSILLENSSNDVDALVIDMLAKSLGIGYLDHLIKPVIDGIITKRSTAAFEKHLRPLKAHEQRKYFNAIIECLTKQYLSANIVEKGSGPLPSSPKISGAASLISGLIDRNEVLQGHTVTLVTQSPLNTLDDSLDGRRSVIAALARNEDKLHDALEKCFRLFGDAFYINHTPLLQQEALAQNLLVACSYVQRSQPMFLTMMAKSTHHISGTSNRIAASSPRARLLGMIVGTVISKLVDKLAAQLKFDLEGDEAIEKQWFEQLVQVNDELGSLADLQVPEKISKASLKAKGPGVEIRSKPSKSRSNPRAPEIPTPRIVEILDDSGSDDDDDLLAYDKPDSDPEDDTEDPTEINRNKVVAPVYIRDLLAGLRDQENYERHELALATAPALIRRKANFGTEVDDHITELASVLTGLNDNLDLPKFGQQRQQALIALLLAKPGPVAQWLARSFFSGDYSITQRVSMLIAMGLGARELAGLKDTSTEEFIPPAASFPSKELAPHLHKIYASEADPVSRITASMAKSMLAPMAADAADRLSGPSVLKVRTFSSRMEVEKRRSKPIPNALAHLVADNFFFPLTGRWWIAVRSSSSADGSLYTSTHLLAPFLRTLALLIHAAGPNTMSLSQMTREFWELLLFARNFAVEDKSVMGALLFAFLMILETSEDRERIANDQAKELLETQEWVRLVFERMGAGTDEDDKLRALAAGVLVRCQEVVDKYQRRMVGAMMEY
ncbi:hypothetical protein BU24DRAFT_442343 [Aaosphaeria arxii CBS 175.79]|uniref:Telomere length regulation protein conserved domain-containing protein n=1 Tax=Aaosphaeria arxii CBS 175.79 TaxID=1450172 RepID=A0A6A5XIV1_9PLEO|nr:uncharacterized protein BU24DRAFT_442343 [Aaosphaeria arxii CBS 175.79]KAF2013188.1 hypothetical protein BU24DRAFT_442343 [Aaosphaeria arxii CBS 175.79]